MNGNRSYGPASNERPLFDRTPGWVKWGVPLAWSIAVVALGVAFYVAQRIATYDAILPQVEYRMRSVEAKLDRLLERRP